MIRHHNPDALPGANSLIPQERPNFAYLLSNSAIGKGFPAVTGNVLQDNMIGHTIPVLGQLFEKIQSHLQIRPVPRYRPTGQ